MATLGRCVAAGAIALLLACAITVSPARATEWPLVGGGLANNHYSPLAQIDRGNVSRLGGAWVSERFAAGSSSRSTPVVKDGVMFFTAAPLVYAIDARTGRTLWTHRTTEDADVEDITVRLNSGRAYPGSQGVAVAEGKVFVGLLDGRVIALDQKTGALRWSCQTGANPPKVGQTVSGAPLYANGRVFTGLADGDWAMRGNISAIDAKTGRLEWQFNVVPAPGEEGFETWAQDNRIWEHGGGGVWLIGVADPALGLVYFGTGNAVPPFGGELRPGDNLYTVSVVALDMKTGKRRWHYQMVHHDLWEADVATPLMLFDGEYDGRMRKGLAAMRSDGYLFLLDRVTGTPLLPIEERAVEQNAYEKTSPTQPFPVGDSLLPTCHDWKPEDIPPGFRLVCTFFPPALPPPSTEPQNALGPYLGARVVPMSYSPQTRYVYAQGIGKFWWRRRTEDPFFFLFGGNIPGLKEKGIFAAIDTRTNRIAWKKEMTPAQLGGSGSLVTAGGLLFRGMGDGEFQAWDAQTGAVLWRYQTGYGGGGSPATSYELDGRQYIAASVGPVIRAYALDGALPPSPAPQLPAPDTGRFKGPIADTAVIETASLNRAPVLMGGQRWFVDEFQFNPYRARVTAGTYVKWINNGRLLHHIVAEDGSFDTGPLHTADEVGIRIDKPGRYAFHCKEHPWSHGELIVEAPDAKASDVPAAVTNNDASFAAQAAHGKMLAATHCALCHGDDLAGRDPAPPLAGERFQLKWSGMNAGELLERIRATMPQAAPGSLDRGTYLAITAYLLQANGVAAGEHALGDDAADLARVKLVAAP